MTLLTTCPREASYVMTYPGRSQHGSCLVCATHKKRIKKSLRQHVKFVKIAGVRRASPCEQMVVADAEEQG